MSSSALPTSGIGAGGPGIWLQCSMNASRLLEKTHNATKADVAAIYAVKVEGFQRSNWSKLSSIILKENQI